MIGRSDELPLTTSRGVYKRKYHLRALFRSIAFVALLGGYHCYNKFVSPEELSAHLQLGHVQADDNNMQGTHVTPSRRLMAMDDEGVVEAEWTPISQYHRQTTTAQCDELEKADSWWMTVLYFVGVLYMFLAIAIVCDEFFVEALDVIASPERLNVNRDVAGATLMAAGGSAPELFTNLIGTFHESEIGFGTILGSAAFNVLLVIALCSVCAREVLDLTWWPLFRDTSYYSASLIVLTMFVAVSSPNYIEWWEAAILFAMYIGYVVVCFKNDSIHYWFTGKELEEVKDDHSAETGDEDSGSLELVKETFANMDIEKTGFLDDEQLKELLLGACADVPKFNVDEAVEDIHKSRSSEVKTSLEELEDWYKNSAYMHLRQAKKEEEEDECGPVWAPLVPPMEDGVLAVLWHLIQLPILVLLTLTIPDVRRPGMAGWCYASFGASILWIGGIAYFMVIWAEIIGNTIGVPHVVMGYTLLAAGTSVPDLLSSVIVTRQGSGDMAISSSIGSNIFDICFGLPVPWLFFHAIRQKNISIDSSNIWISIFVFLAMIVLVVGVIHCQGWRLTKKLGGAMMVLYLVFLAQAIYFELPFPC